jgi:hypothetical protein
LIIAGELVAAKSQVIGAYPNDFPCQTISLASESGSIIEGWHITAKKSKGVIVLLHGIRGSRLSMIEQARLLYNEYYSILMIDL